MLCRRVFLLTLFSGFFAPVTHGFAQEVRPIQKFGEEGKFFGSVKNGAETKKYYLLSRQQVGDEDMTGFSGDARVVIESDAGGYEVKQFAYFARCLSVDGSTYNVTFSIDVQDLSLAQVDDIRIHPKIVPSS